MSNDTPNKGFIIEQTPVGEKKKDAYYKLLNAKGTNALAAVPTTITRARIVFKPLEGEKYPTLFAPDDIKIELRGTPDDVLLGQAKKFYYYLIKKFTEKTPHDIKNFDNDKKENREVPIDVADYLQLLGKEITSDNKKNAARNIRKYVEALGKARIFFEEINPKTQRIKKYEFFPLSGQGYEEEVITKKARSYFIVLNKDAVAYLLERNYITMVPALLWQTTDVKYPNAFSLGYELSIFYNLNRGKPNQGSIGLNDLLPRLSDIPNLDEMKKDRHYSRRIIERLEETLDYLQEIGILDKWEWGNKDREPLEEGQLKDYSYKTLADCYLNYRLKDYPLIEKKAQEEPKKTKKTPKKV